MNTWTRIALALGICALVFSTRPVQAQEVKSRPSVQATPEPSPFVPPVAAVAGAAASRLALQLLMRIAAAEMAAKGVTPAQRAGAPLPKAAFN